MRSFFLIRASFSFFFGACFLFSARPFKFVIVNIPTRLTKWIAHIDASISRLSRYVVYGQTDTLQINHVTKANFVIKMLSLTARYRIWINLHIHFRAFGYWSELLTQIGNRFMNLIP